MEVFLLSPYVWCIIIDIRRLVSSHSVVLLRIFPLPLDSPVMP